MKSVFLLQCLVLCVSSFSCHGFSAISPASVRTRHNRPSTATTALFETDPSSSRRVLLRSLLLSTTILSPSPATAKATRAVGLSEKLCRERGDCLETGDWDGAVGWNWGGKERCDASDPRCSADGKLRDGIPQGKEVPSGSSNKITEVAEIFLKIGRGNDSQEVSLKLGLYGEDCPVLVKQLCDFLGSDGLLTTSRLLLEEGYGATSLPVSFANGGSLVRIYPEERLDFGVPSQSVAYAKRMGKAKAGDDFVPQPRPSKSFETSTRTHDAAGLLSIPADGLGYNSVLESEDEAFGSAFQITASPKPEMDRDRKVVGQILDKESMVVLARLASLPTQKGLKGILPGMGSGPPLVRVNVVGVTVARADEQSSTS